MNDIYLYLLDNLDSFNDDFIDDFIDEYFPKLPRFRQEQCIRFRQKHDKRNCILAYMLLELGLKEQYGKTTPISFIYNKHGKPYLYEYPNIFFNISHCKDGVVCALAYIEVGVDIQNIGVFDWNIARRVCSKAELLMLANANNPTSLFCKLWTKREAYAKSMGVGLASVFQLDLENVEFLEWNNGDYYISLFAREEWKLCSQKLIVIPKNLSNQALKW